MKKNRIPKGFKFEEGKNYSIKFKRSEYKYIYDKKMEWYVIKHFVNNKLKDEAYIISKDVLSSINYKLSLAGEKYELNEITK